MLTGPVRASLLLATLAVAGCHAVVVVAALDEHDLSSGTSDPSTDDPSTAAGSTDPTTTAACEPLPLAACDDDLDPFHALGLGCPGAPLDEATLLSKDPFAARTAVQLGNAVWTARAGSKLLALTTGVLPAPDPSGLITIAAGAATPGTANDNPDAAPLPAPADAAAVGDHWQVAQSFDLVALRFAAAVPGDMRGFAVDVALLTAEFPRRADQEPGDALAVWLTSERFTGDVARLGDDPLTPHALRDEIADGGLFGDAPALLGTGMDGVTAEACDYGWAGFAMCPVGGALAWHTLRAAVSPGEAIVVVVALADHGDAGRDTLALLDAWRWTCDACTPDVDCGLTPADP